MKELKYTEKQINEIGILLGEIEVKGEKNHEYILTIYHILKSFEEIKNEDEVGDE